MTPSSDLTATTLPKLEKTERVDGRDASVTSLLLLARGPTVSADSDDDEVDDNNDRG